MIRASYRSLPLLLVILVGLASGASAESADTYFPYRANLHLHTLYSFEPSWFPDHSTADYPADTLFRAQELQPALQCVGLSDHGEAIGSIWLPGDPFYGFGLSEWDVLRFVSRSQSEAGFIALAGFEWSPAGGSHVSVFGADQYCGTAAWTDGFSGDLVETLDDLYGWVSRQPGKLVAQFNHPWLADFDNFRRPDIWSNGGKLDKAFCLLEVAGGPGTAGLRYFPIDRIGEVYYSVALQQGWHVAPAIGHDNYGALTSLSRARHTGVYAPTNASQDDIIDALRARRAFASEDTELELSLKARLAGTQTMYWMGEQVATGGAGVWCQILADDPGDELRDRYEYIRLVDMRGNTILDYEWSWPGTKFFTEVFLSNHTIQSLPANPEGERPIYVVLKQVGFVGLDKDMAVTAPIWLDPRPTRNVDVALVIDASGSMSWNDPQGLRKTAAKFFVDLAQPGDRIGVVAFTDQAWALAPLTQISSDADRGTLKAAIDQVSDLWSTNIAAGLSLGYDLLAGSPDPSQHKAGLLLTDGMHNVGWYGNEHLLYADRGWPVYVIGLGWDTDPTFLSRIATESGGTYYSAPSNETLTAIYQELSRRLGGRGVLIDWAGNIRLAEAIQHGFRVPAGTPQITVVTTWTGSDIETTLNSPSGRVIGRGILGPDVYHVQESTYEIYRINEPEAGEWLAELVGVDVPAEGETVGFTVEVTQVSGDTTPPEIIVTSPLEGKAYYDSTPVPIAFSVSDPESGVTSVTALVDGSIPVADGDQLPLSDLGVHTLTVTATNGVGLTSTSNVTFELQRFRWLSPFRYRSPSDPAPMPLTLRQNATVPLKFSRWDATTAFVADETVRVVVEGTTAAFEYGAGGDTTVRITTDRVNGTHYIVNLHTNLRKWDYGLSARNEYWVSVYFDNILAGRAKIVVR